MIHHGELDAHKRIIPGRPGLPLRTSHELLRSTWSLPPLVHLIVIPSAFDACSNNSNNLQVHDVNVMDTTRARTRAVRLDLCDALQREHTQVYAIAHEHVLIHLQHDWLTRPRRQTDPNKLATMNTRTHTGRS